MHFSCFIRRSDQKVILAFFCMLTFFTGNSAIKAIMNNFHYYYNRQQGQCILSSQHDGPFFPKREQLLCFTMFSILSIDARCCDEKPLNWLTCEMHLEKINVESKKFESLVCTWARIAFFSNMHAIPLTFHSKVTFQSATALIGFVADYVFAPALQKKSRVRRLECGRLLKTNKKVSLAKRLDWINTTSKI